jgi:hypothetical protein
MRRLEDREQWLDHRLGCLTILPYYSFIYFLLLSPASKEKLPPYDSGSGEIGESSPPEGTCSIHLRKPSHRGAIFALPDGEGKTSIR